MKKFEYDAKISSVRGMIKDLNEQIDAFNDLVMQISECKANADGDNEKYVYMMMPLFEDISNRYAESSMIIPDRLLTLKDEQISKMIISDEDIVPIIVDYARIFNNELSDVEEAITEIQELTKSLFGL